MNSIIQERSREVNQYRPEQIRAQLALQKFFPDYLVLMEYWIPQARTLADIIMIGTCNKCHKAVRVVINLNGAIHRISKVVRHKDKQKREALEKLGYTVIDFDDDKMPHLFAKTPQPKLYLEIAKTLHAYDFCFFGVET